MQTQTLTPIQEQIEIVGRELNRLHNIKNTKVYPQGYIKTKINNLVGTLRVLQAQRKLELI